ncbi:MAG: hypothetical protein NZ703_05945 [Gemmataceae bacterium]|nr:hypothetical protein [Gemmataceae bacterium]MCS7270609.1 hypothetical protein [Gemmataceae bacterium]MDW8244341.1 hypothetical protein [Thermogemmata sp.]
MPARLILLRRRRIAADYPPSAPCHTSLRQRCQASLVFPLHHNYYPLNANRLTCLAPLTTF